MPPHKKPRTEGKENPEWMKVVSDVLEHKDNKDFVDSKNIVLATVDAEGQPYARYHVHRGFVQDDGKDLPLLLTTTDKLMPKTGQIEASAKGKAAGSPSEYVFWASPTGDQIRIRGLVHLYTPTSPASEQSVASLLPDFDWEALRLKQWKGLSSHLRATFVHEAPGEPVGDNHEEEVEKLEVGDEREETALERFCLVVFEPKKVDWSQQNEKPPNRFTWTLENNGSWTKQRVAV